MSGIFLLLDFLIPLFFFFLGRSLKGEKRREVIRESLFVFLLSLLFAPVSYAYLSLSAQGALCAALIFVQYLGICHIQYGKAKKLP